MARPSPTDSATWYEPLTIKRGNDGNLWTISVNSAGTHRWIKTNNPIGSKEVIYMSAKHPQYNQAKPFKKQHRFKVGQVVKVIRSGYGCGIDEVGDIATITELGDYAIGNDGYKVSPPMGNMKIGAYSGFIGEDSFEIAKLTTAIKTINGKPFKLNNKTKTMAKTKVITKRTTAETRTIDTSLINKEEVFKMLALAEATGLPLLLVGKPGVAKTKTVIEYAKAWLNKDGKMSAEDFAKKIYVLETDEGTKASEIKGMPDLSKLFQDNKYEIAAPIADAEIVVINEVDKASSAIRNAMLGVMNEKFLFNGKSKIPCKWKLFVATCNEIPKEEVGSPFWDRFMLKMEVSRVTAGELVKYYKKGARDYRETFTIGIPNKTEMATLEVPVNKMEKYLEVGYQTSSDRTLTFVPMLTKAVSYIWDISVDKSLVKTASIMISQTAASELSNKLMSGELKVVMSKVDMLKSYKSSEQLEMAIGEIESLVSQYAAAGHLDEGQVNEIETTIQVILDSHPAAKDWSTTKEFQEVVEGM